MKKSTQLLIVSILTIIIVVNYFTYIKKVQAESVDENNNEEISIIVEFKEEPKMIQENKDDRNINKSNIENKIKEEHEVVKDYLDEVLDLKESEYIEEIYSEVFNGMAINIPANKVEDLLELDVIKAVYENDIVNVNPINEVEESGVNISALSSKELGINDLHNEGITGKGIKVAIIDTGIDYNHPDLKDVYVGGYDFVDNDNDPMETTYNDWLKSGKSEFNSKGESYYTQHGTHVAGIIAGQGTSESDLSVKGVSPDVDIYAYRVLGPYGLGYTSDILAAIEAAINDGVDIINMSLAANVNNNLYPTSIAINNATLAGVVSVVSSGNSGPNYYSVGSPGTSSLAITVGATTSDINIERSKISLLDNIDEKFDLRLIARDLKEKANVLDGKELELVEVGNGGLEEYKGKDVNGKVVIATRGMHTLQNIIINAKQNGAVAALIQNYNEEEGHIPHYIGEDFRYIPAFSIGKVDGDNLRVDLSKNNKIVFTDFDEYKEYENTLTNFSSKGPVKETYDIKPEIVAPGEGINSSIPWFMDGLEDEGDYTYAYKKMNGTSMSAPYITGTVALMLQNDSTLNPEDVKVKLMNTSETLDNNYSVFEVGAGSVNPYNAVKSDINISVSGDVVIDEGENGIIETNEGDLNFGVIKNQYEVFENTRSVLIENKDENTKAFDVEIIENSNNGISLDWNSNEVNLDIPSDIIVNSNESKNIDITINVPIEASVGSYEGYIIFTNKNNTNEVYRIPFAVSKIEVEEGIKDFYLDSNIISTPVGYDSEYIIDSTDVNISLYSEVEKVVFEVLEGDTNKVIGKISEINGELLEPNTEYEIFNFKGEYLPKVDEEYKNNFEKLSTGRYKMRMIVIDLDGESYSREIPFYVDNKMPEIKEVTLDTVNGEIKLKDKVTIYEYNPDIEQEINISGIFYDEDLDKIIDAKIDPFEREGFENYYGIEILGADNSVEFNKDGSFKGIINNFDNNEVSRIKVQAIDAVGNTSINDIRYIDLVKEETKYVSLVSDKLEYTKNDIPIIKVSLNNSNDIKELSFSYKVNSKIVNIDKISLIEKYEDDAVISYKKSMDKDGYDIIEGKIIFNNPINTDKEVVEIAEITLENNNKYWYNGEILLEGKSQYINSNGDIKEVETLSIGYINNPESILVTLDGYLAEGLVKEIEGKGIVLALGSDFDYDSLGIDISIEDLSGKSYDISYNNDTNKFESILPLENNNYKAVIDVPSHFTVYKNFKVDRLEQIKKPYHIKLDYNPAIAGDINKDNVIDINDAIEISKRYKNIKNDDEEYLIGDVNFDGVIDKLDFGFVVNNYKVKNTTLPESKEPILEKYGIDIDDIEEDLKDDLVHIWINKAIEEAKDLDYKKYTEESYKKLKIVVKKAESILSNTDNEKITQKDINDLENDIINAINNLINITENDDIAGELPETGETTIVAIGILAISLIFIGLFLAKKKKV